MTNGLLVGAGGGRSFGGGVLAGVVGAYSRTYKQRFRLVLTLASGGRPVALLDSAGRPDLNSTAKGRLRWSVALFP